jgi:hypothetical protein
MTRTESAACPSNRIADRIPVNIPARLTWKDKRGMTRFASVIARDVSESGVYVECPSEIVMQMYRLVQFQTERAGADQALPTTLRQGGRMLSAVYRITPPTKSGGRQGLGLRLIVEPKRTASPVSTLERARATA